MNQPLTRRFRLLLTMSRVRNLPSVWSNCLAGWWLGGAETFGKLPLLLLGVSTMYLGGCFLNDAFDAGIDRRRRPERPLPAGKISREFVWCSGFGLLALGVLLLVVCSKAAGVAAVLLTVFILLYNATHQFLTASPWLMGICRFWLYVIAGAVGANGLNGWPIYCGVALAFYVAGLGYIGWREHFRGPIPRWPLLLLSSPLVLAMLMNAKSYRVSAVGLAVVLASWTALSMQGVFRGTETSPARVAANLTAGMVLVDWLAVFPVCPLWLTLIFPVLFGLTKLLQRAMPPA